MNEKRIQELIFKLETVGFDCFEDFLDDDLIISLKEKLIYEIENYKVFAESERSKLDRYHLHHLLNVDIEFGKLLEDSRLENIINSVLCKNWIMYAFTSSSLPPNSNNYGSRLHVDCPRWISNYPTNIGVIWALDDFTTENGGTYVLPGSHNTDIIPSDEIFEKNKIQLTCKKGSLIVFNARLWHKAGFNNTDIFRHALTMNVCRPFMKQRMDWVKFVSPEILNQLNVQAQRIIGFDTRIPTNLEEFFKPDNERLYKSNQE